MLAKWDDLPSAIRIPEVRPYYDILNQKRLSIAIKRLLDCILAFLLLFILMIPMVIISIWIKLDSPGPILYRQERITQYNKRFRIHKFRTMVSNADAIGSTVTVNNDSRITRVGKKIRSLRLDEIPQLFDVLIGDMSFVGTRPEAVKYVGSYQPEYMATLLLPAGITSEATIRYKDEARLLDAADDVDQVYLLDVLPQKMAFNLSSIKHFGLLSDIKTLIRTVFAVLGKNYD